MRTSCPPCLALQTVIFLYLLDNDTSYMILASSGVGLAIEVSRRKWQVMRRDWRVVPIRSALAMAQARRRSAVVLLGHSDPNSNPNPDPDPDPDPNPNLDANH
eukprot:5587337-Pleurochrysis_carterae.AAC.1